MTIYLDRRGDAPLPAQALAIESERALLEALLQHTVKNDASTFLIKGAALCDWAQVAARARGWKCATWSSPLEALGEAFSTLTREDASALWEQLGEAGGYLPQPYRAGDILQLLHPDFDWLDAPSPARAAAWLLWLDETNEEATGATRVLMLLQIAQWHAQHETLAPLYADSPQSARRVLDAWLGISDETIAANVGVFPISIPARWTTRAVAAHEKRLTQNGVAAWTELSRQSLPMELIESLAGATANFLRHHAAQISPAVLASLAPHLTASDATSLRRLSPPRAPSPLPTRVEDVLQWATRDYLPFRLWQAENENIESRNSSDETAIQAAQQFGAWFLEWYGGALVGAGATHLAHKKSEALRASEESAIVLWVIADGLGWLDAQAVAHHLTSRYPRFALQSSTPALSTIPTITRFAKPSLRWSTPPAGVAAEEARTSKRREDEVAGHRAAATALCQAAPGDIVIWKPLEPDATYHKIADRSIARANVENILRALAENIAEAALAPPSGCNIKIVLSTDHGRLLSHAPRVHEGPNDLEVHGRAAYSPEAIARAYDENGVAREGAQNHQIAWLDPDRFGLGVSVAIVLDEGAFKIKNVAGSARGGIEMFPHGGVFPEEVVVPWLEFARDGAAPQVSIVLSGRARSGTRAMASVTATNSSAQQLSVQSTSLHVGGREYSAVGEGALEPFSTREWKLEIESWPASHEWKSANATIILQRPDGQTMEVAPELQTETEELQTREIDLLGEF